MVAEAAELEGRWKDIAFLDDQYARGTIVESWPIAGSIAAAAKLSSIWSHFIIAIGNNEQRVEVSDQIVSCGLQITDIVHPRAYLSTRARSEGGTAFLAGSVVNARAVLGRNCIVNTGATVDHDCQLSDGVHISPGAHLAANARIGRLSWIGVGASVREGITVGHHVIVGAGAAVVSQIDDNRLVKGVPAK